jgi:hypothetical protein
MRILKIKRGYNPNSSSLSLNMTVLLAASALVNAVTFLAATLVRLSRKR